LHFSGPVCGGFNDPNCGDWWAELPPQGIFDFNCQVTAYSAFPVTFGGIWVNEICNGEVIWISGALHLGLSAKKQNQS
jgi:hypothetical protein